MPTGPQRRSELPPCSWRQTCAFAFCMAGVSGRVVMVSVTGFGRGRPSVRPQVAPCLCRCGCRRVQSPEERRNAPLFSGRRSSPSVAGGVHTHVRRLHERPRAARASITRAGYPRGECAQRRGARAPAPQSGVLCRVRGAPRQRLGRVASGWQSRFGTATTDRVAGFSSQVSTRYRLRAFPCLVRSVSGLEGLQLLGLVPPSIGFAVRPVVELAFWLVLHFDFCRSWFRRLIGWRGCLFRSPFASPTRQSWPSYFFAGEEKVLLCPW